ncbi:UDP-glucose 4-epimerase family protein [Pseudomonas psychrophila]|uniref:SDR family oxidoreductase n=1 Tax=Pseudomonas psychrophila TaxID=122355 RepID=A0A8I1KCY4_9PSED|nr:SDR family oxidoreductase [Pseudomonas psychrophila]MBJ2260072.1 SDR family oxidoreductase [Pseudomonas psychrophila]
MLDSILLTGATGFVGQAVVRRLVSDGCLLTAVLRHNSSAIDKRVITSQIESLDGDTCWEDSLSGINVVIHCAARVHVMGEEVADPIAAFRKVNVEGTFNLARQAAKAGVRRFIYISSIKVNGESTSPGTLFTAFDIPAPVDPYGVSKMEAERELQALAMQTDMELVIIRPVLVYGPGVKANFLNMLSWLEKGIPLPLGAINNRRSLVALENLVDLISTCISHPAAANQVFLVSDGDDVSTTQLLQHASKFLSKPSLLVPVPSALLSAICYVFGRRSFAQRLCGSLQVDISHTRDLLGWKPPVSLQTALHETVKYYLESKK